MQSILTALKEIDSSPGLIIVCILALIVIIGIGGTPKD
jgi:hypothetical protein